MRARPYLILLPLLLAAGSLRGEPVGTSTVRVMLHDDTASVELRPDAAGVLTDLETGVRRELVSGQTYIVRTRDGGLRFGTWNLGNQVRWAPADGKGVAALNTRRYRGTILLDRREEAGGFRVINELGVEEYLYSVLGKEMSAEWPMEALKAQAVISRSYALKNLGRYDDEGYDLLDDVRSQVYQGVETEHPRVIAAVNETLGQVLAYNGILLSTHFHSCCGGHTSALETAWTGTSKSRPLQGVRDSFCANTPHYRWAERISSDVIIQALAASGKTVKKIKGISVGRRDASGYVRILKVATDAGTYRIRAAELRKMLGFRVVKSTYLTKIAVKKDYVKLEGKGWGHGVGLCQWGARAQAAKGRKYRNILKFYYPGAKVATWKT